MFHVRKKKFFFYFFFNIFLDSEEKKDDEALFEMSQLVLDFFPSTLEMKPKMEEIFQNFCRVKKKKNFHSFIGFFF